MAEWRCRVALPSGAAEWRCRVALPSGAAEWRCRVALPSGAAVTDNLKIVYLFSFITSIIISNRKFLTSFCF
jgi:uncharacterized lipoprotein YbaY